MKLERTILAFLVAVLIIVTPTANPAFAASVGGVFAEPLQFLATTLNGLFTQLQQFQGDIYQYVIAAGVSAPLTFAIVALLKKAPMLAKYNSQHIATLVALVLYILMMVAQKYGQELAYNNGVQVAVLLLSVIAGTGTTQLAASSIHDKFLDTPLALAYSRGNSIVDVDQQLYGEPKVSIAEGDTFNQYP